jgi:hypothetical protein
LGCVADDSHRTNDVVVPLVATLLYSRHIIFLLVVKD